MSAGSDRLERTRLAILEHIHRKELRRHGREPGEAAPGDGDAAGRHAAAAGMGRRRGGDGWLDQAREQLDAWWRYHPAHVAVDAARPMLASYARRKPMHYLGMATAAGAAVMLLRPWKLISVTGLVVALVKSPQMASLLMSALSSAHNPDDDPPTDDA